MKSKLFTWVPLYQELADKLLAWQGRQDELIQFIESLREQGLTVTPLSDKKVNSSEKVPIKEIDPFTFFGIFNRQIKDESRLGILAEMKKFFDCKSELPSDFVGIPILNNQKSRYVNQQITFGKKCVPKLWRVFEIALSENPLENLEFAPAYDDALSIKGVNINLSMGLFWIRPETFLNMDRTNRDYLELETEAYSTGDNYITAIKTIKSRRKESLLKISHDAYLVKTKTPVSSSTTSEISQHDTFWIVGAVWNAEDQTEVFVNDGLWMDGYVDGKHADLINQMKIGERIAIKSSFTRKNKLPFDANGNTVSVMKIKARGVIVANRQDGRTVEVEWEPDFEPKKWYLFTYLKTVWKLQLHAKYKHKAYRERLIRHVFYDEPQDYEWFCERWNFGDNTNETSVSSSTAPQTHAAYSVEDIVEEGAFLDENELQQIIDRLREKKNLILQGAPGVGKTFLAQRLAYALMQEKDKDRIKLIQFHQSYSYEDFIRGFRPSTDKAGAFSLKDGVFFSFCEQARNDSDRDYVLIIDEINRGNLSQIFGELLMLIEKDKRKEEFSVPLMYSNKNEPEFFVPPNLYIIGMMNLADRSLAIVDYALRRRFAFKTLKPKFNKPSFRTWLEDKSMDKKLIELIVSRLSALNEDIESDDMLGENYTIGHSYFCPQELDLSKKNRAWFDSIVETEIVPLVKEYWFDNPEKQAAAKEKLLAP